MRIRTIAAVAVLALGFACTDNGTDDDLAATDDVTAADEFTLTGSVLDAQAGAEPDTGDTSPDASPTPAGTAEDFGGMAIRPDADGATNLDDCETDRGAYLTYYTADTTFAEGMREADDFPESLESTRVSVTGSLGDDEGGPCVLMLDEVDEAVAAPEDDDTTGGTTGTDDGMGTGDDDESPGPSASPEARGFEDTFFPEVEDTDPVFEGTASPDPCEGKKACLETDGP